jgi:OOP family OmpA-OmpF porin
MIRPAQLASFGTALCTLNACIGLDPTSVTQIEPKGDAFQTALHAEYAELAIQESTRYDFSSATVYARKAKASAAGQDVAPEQPERWNINAYALSELNQARDKMLSMLRDTQARERAPFQTAAAQAALDCWIEEQHEGHQARDIQACRQRFEDSLAEVRVAMDMQTDVLPAAGPASERLPEHEVEREYEVFFRINSTRLAADAQAVVRRLADNAQATGASGIEVTGHTDRTGPRAYNERLSRMRARAVAEQLIDLGIPAERIRTEGSGEDQPAVTTADGIANQMNRRVVIRLL